MRQLLLGSVGITMNLLEFQCLFMVITIINLVPLNAVDTTSEMSINQTDQPLLIDSQPSLEPNQMAAVASNSSPTTDDHDNNLLTKQRGQKKNGPKDPEAKRPYYVVNFPFIYGPNRLVPRDIRVNISTIGDAQQSEPKTERTDPLKIDLICKPASGTQFDYRLVGQLGTCRFNFDPNINFDDNTNTTITADQPTKLTIYLEDPKNSSSNVCFKLTSSASSTKPTVHDTQNETSIEVPLIQPVPSAHTDGNSSQPTDHYIAHRQPNDYKYYNDYGSPQRYFQKNLYDDDDVHLAPNPPLKVSVVHLARSGMASPIAMPSRRVDLNRILDDYSEYQSKSLSPSSDEATTRENINIWGYWNQFVFPPHDNCPATLTQRQLPTDNSLVEKRKNSENTEDDSESHQKRLAAETGQVSEDANTELTATLLSNGLANSDDDPSQSVYSVLVSPPDEMATEAINDETRPVCSCREFHEKRLPCVHDNPDVQNLSQTEIR